MLCVCVCVYMCVCVCVCVYVCACVCIYIYIHRERERPHQCCPHILKVIFYSKCPGAQVDICISYQIFASCIRYLHPVSDICILYQIFVSCIRYFHLAARMQPTNSPHAAHTFSKSISTSYLYLGRIQTYTFIGSTNAAHELSPCCTPCSPAAAPHILKL